MTEDMKHVPEAKDVDALKAAAKSGDREGVAAYLARFGAAHVDKRTADNMTALIYAAWMGHPEIVELLLDHGANINHRGNLGKTPLGFAAFSGNTKVVEVLLERGADATILDNHDWSPAYQAHQMAHYETRDTIINWAEISLQRKAERAQRERQLRENAAIAHAEDQRGQLQQRRPLRPALKKQRPQ